MRILIPTADYPPIEGGISTVALQVSRELAAMGHDVTVVAPFFRGIDEFDAGEPVTVERFRGYWLGFLRVLPMWLKTWRHVRETDLVLAINVTHGGLIAAAAKRLAGKPFLTFAYAYEFMKFRKNFAVAPLLRKIYADSVGVVAISSFTKDNLLEFGVSESKVKVVFPGASCTNSCTPEEIAAVKHKYVLDTDHVILGAGRFMPRKGHVRLVKAMPKVLEKFPDAVLILAGRGPCLDEAIKLTYDLGIREQVTFPGMVPDEDLAALYHACEVFALPTGCDRRGQVEGFGLVFVEANACGKPVVAGRSGGVADAVIDGETGIIIEPEDEEALADAIISLMEDPKLAERLGKAGKRRVEKELNWRNFTQQMLDVAKDNC